MPQIMYMNWSILFMFFLINFFLLFVKKFFF